MDKESQVRIGAYYDRSMFTYRLWHGNTYALHTGLWTDTTANRYEALLNTNRVIADVARISPGDTVLDAGCGVGGTAIWLAMNRGVRVIGLTLSNKQVEIGKRLARQYNLEGSVDIRYGDFLDTGLEDESVDCIIGVESVCYAPNKSDFVKEAMRVLREKGRLAVADAFLKRDPQTFHEEWVLKNMCLGFEIDSMGNIDEFTNSLSKHGFSGILVSDKSDEVLPSIRLLYIASKVEEQISRAARALRLPISLARQQNFGGLSMHPFIESGMGTYAIVSAVKENNPQA